MVIRSTVLAALIGLVAGCAAEVPVPDLCDMPPGFRGWQGAHVSWSGFLVGEHHHGFLLACEEHRGGISFSTDENTIGREALRSALNQFLAVHAQDGMLRISVEGRLGQTYGETSWRDQRVDEPILRITAVRRIWFQRMSRAEVRAILNR